jgi:hypothetical protein
MYVFNVTGWKFGENMSTQQRQIITRLIKNADLNLKKFGEWPSGDEEEENRFGLDCEDCGIIYISLNPKGSEPMEVQAVRQYQNHVTAKHR